MAEKISRRRLITSSPVYLLSQLFQFTPPPMPAPPPMSEPEQDHAIREVQGAVDVLIWMMGFTNHEIREMRKQILTPGWYPWWQGRKRQI